MKKVKTTRVAANDEVEKPNPFDYFYFWLELAYMDFTFEMTEAEE